MDDMQAHEFTTQGSSKASLSLRQGPVVVLAFLGKDSLSHCKGYTEGAGKGVLLSGSGEIAYRQLSVLFTERELHIDGSLYEYLWPAAISEEGSFAALLQPLPILSSVLQVSCCLVAQCL